jgi:3-oxoacyl-[acyl-carrier-protein] synthase-3
MIRIKAAGHALGEETITNFDLEKIVNTSDEWIFTRTGIKQRHFTKGSAIDLAIKSVEDLQKKFPNQTLEDIDLIIFATMTADSSMPSQASKIQKHFGIKNSVAFDLAAACSGFVFAIEQVVNSFKANPNKYKKALVIGCDKMSRTLDVSDRGTYVLFGDGSGAVILENSPQTKYVLNSNSIIDTKDSLTLDFKTQTIQMKGQEVYKFAVKNIDRMIKQATSEMGDHFDLYIPHQANLRMIESVAQKSKIPQEKFLMNIDRVANTSAASIPIVISENISKIQKGQKVMMFGFGGGLTYGYFGLEWDED